MLLLAASARLFSALFFRARDVNSVSAQRFTRSPVSQHLFFFAIRSPFVGSLPFFISCASSLCSQNTFSIPLCCMRARSLHLTFRTRFVDVCCFSLPSALRSTTQPTISLALLGSAHLILRSAAVLLFSASKLKHQNAIGKLALYAHVLAPPLALPPRGAPHTHTHVPLHCTAEPLSHSHTD